MYPYSTHCANNSSTKPGSPKRRRSGVQQVQSQRNTGNGSGGVHRPQSQKPQCRIHQQLQGKAQGRPEDPQQCDEKKASSKPAMIF